MKPVIGITSCSRLDDYVASVEQAGGRARVIDCTASARALVNELQGVLLTGGGDVDPALYGEERHESVEDAEPGRDEFEIDLARRAMDAGLPVLGICRGAQVLNVAAGGTLLQDIPSQADEVSGDNFRLKAEATSLVHSIEVPKDAVAHDVTVTPGSRLERALGGAVGAGRLCRVNSRHHQSVARVGQSLVPVATAPDGVIEAIERRDADFCIGVQWHPENYWRTGEFAPLFQSFIQAALARIP